MKYKSICIMCLFGSLFIFSGFIFSGFILSGCILTGCAKNDKKNESSGLESPATESDATSTSGDAAHPKEDKNEGTAAHAAQRPPLLEDFGGKVIETMNASRYTYMLVDTGNDQVWAAVPECTVHVGDDVKLPKGIPMDQFHSETLDRTFDLIYFTQSVKIKGAKEGDARTQDASAMDLKLPQGHPMVDGSSQMSGKGEATMDYSGLKKPDGGMTVDKIFTNKARLSGKEVVVRGKVVKFNSKIMGKNWLHLRDGTGKEGTNDLTVNTKDVASVGDTVLVRGVIVLDKDFGFGYKYDVLIEDASVTVE